MILTPENYYSQEADMEYMSVSQFKNFSGTSGQAACEFRAMEELNRRWADEPTTAMLIGSYVDAYFEGTLDSFKDSHPEIFKKDGGLKAEYLMADRIIERLLRDKYFMKYMSGEKQVIMTGELFGTKWKIKMDSYLPNIAIVDMKIMASIRKSKWVADFGPLDFVRFWGYDIQGAIYQEIVRQNTGKNLPFYIAAATKEKEPDIAIIHVTQNYLNEAMAFVEANINRVLEVKNGESEPDWCEQCDCCKHNRVLTGPISIADLVLEI